MKRSHWYISMLLAPVLAMAGATSSGSLGSACALSEGSSAAKPCCKVCTTGKACGDSCIAKEKTCHKGAGCACNG
jgi:hypothetical protein